jgi:FAD-dependent urate hydroxylase
MRSLGLGEALAGAAAVLPRWTFADQRGEVLCETDLRALWGDVGPCLGITRIRLQRILAAGAAGVPHRLGVAVTGIAQDGDRVAVAFSDGSEAGYDLVVGADGIHSTVRRLAVSDVAPAYADTMAWRSVAAARPAGVEHLLILMGEGCFFGLVPVEDGQTYGFAGVGSERFDDPAPGRLERFRDRFAAFGGPVPEYLTALERDDQLHAGPIEWLDLDRWHAGRVVLVGDAAHAAPPHMGEGGAMALEDALALAESLEAAPSVEAALEAYVARRRPRVEWVQEQSRIAARAWVLPPEVRDQALRERGDQMLRDRYAPLVAAP